MSDKTSDADTPDLDPEAPAETKAKAETPDTPFEDAALVDEKKPFEHSDLSDISQLSDASVDKPGWPPRLGFAVGGVAAAVIGASVMYFAMPQPEIPFDEARLEALEGALNALQNAPAPVIEAPVVDLSGLDRLSERLVLLESAMAEMNLRLEEIAGVDAVGKGGVANSTVAAQLSEMQAALEDQRTENAAVQAELAAIASQAAAKIAQAEARAVDAQAEAAERAERAARQASVAKLAAAVETGVPFDDVLDALRVRGAALPDGLDAVASTGVPTLLALQNSYGAAARVGLVESVKATMGGSMGERFTAFLRSQVGARSLEAREGDHPDAILSRAEAALRAGRMDAVLTELATLPAEGRAAMQSWIDLASARQTALVAISALNSALTEN